MARTSENDRYDLSSRRKRFLGITKDQALKGLFGGNAFVSILVLALITVFLFREGAGFFGQYRKSLELYRTSGIEFVDIVRDKQDAFTKLSQYLNSILTVQSKALSAEGLSFPEVKRRLEPIDDFAYGFDQLSSELRGFVQDSAEIATTARNLYQERNDLLEYRSNLQAAGREEEAEAVEVPDVDLSMIVGILREKQGELAEIGRRLAEEIPAFLESAPEFEDEVWAAQMKTFKATTLLFVESLPQLEVELQEWKPDRSVGLLTAFTGFVFGEEWTTNSALQDWYGLIPLFGGSLLVASIAMCFAVPLGVSAAIYVNQVANAREQQLIKPFIEFISAIPSVVIGFFGIAVFGTVVRELSQSGVLDWLPFFPISERLNAFTAGCLLALMAVPTIFTLAEDSLNNVPKAYTEASMAMGATKLQTTMRIIVPTSLSGIISAILLGFGRVIGETMVVLLCAGNRIAIPDLSKGLGVVFEPVHTMTGIIAQELGEVVNGSMHYRALFMVGMALFVISLLINYLAQKVVLRYQISRG